MRKNFELPAMQIVEVKKQDIVCASPYGDVNATIYGTFEEENIFL